MFNFFKKSPQNLKSEISNLKLSLSGLHCSSCAVNIDLSLEDLNGVQNSTTNYAKSFSVISYEAAKIDPKTIIAEINKLGYQAKPNPKI